MVEKESGWWNYLGLNSGFSSSFFSTFKELYATKGSQKSINYLCPMKIKPLLLSLALSFVFCGLLASCGGGGGGSSCNVAAGQFCDIGKYCKYENNSCGRDGSSGSCADIPANCPAEIATVCTCDSLTFNNECFAAQAGQSIQAAGECA